MFKLTKLITLNPEISATDKDGLIATLQSAHAGPKVIRAMLQPTHPNVMNGGDFIWHLQFADEPAYRAALGEIHWRKTIAPALANDDLVAHIDSAAYASQACGQQAPGLKGGVYRTLLLSVRAGTPRRQIDRFDTEMRAMPHYIHAIRNWGYSHVGRIRRRPQLDPCLGTGIH